MPLMDDLTKKSIVRALYPDEFGDREPHDGFYVRWFFPNGYGASLASGCETYGVELAVLKGDRNEWTFAYDTPITGAVIRHIENLHELERLLHSIFELPRAE